MRLEVNEQKNDPAFYSSFSYSLIFKFFPSIIRDLVVLLQH